MPASPLKRLPIVVLIYIFIFLPELCWTLSSSHLERQHVRGDLHSPCSFFDTVNVTADQRFENGSYLHDGIMIPHHYIGVYTKVYQNAVTWTKVEPHLRGCICKLKRCINFCCPFGMLHFINTTAEMCIEAEFDWPHLVNMTQKNGTIREVDVLQQYAVVDFRPCESMYGLDPRFEPEDAWKIFENGSVLIELTQALLTRQDYCMVPTASINESGVYYLNPANCSPDSSGTVKTINAYTMLFSIPFMLLTIIVYLIIPELRNQHGKSLVCYLSNLTVGYILMAYTNLDKDIESRAVGCKVIGYTCYYAFLSAFFWLNVISFDLWHNFRGTRGISRTKEQKRFIMYSLYSWGLPVPFLAVTLYIQEYVDVPYAFQPGIGGGEYCWINMKTWSGFIYFFTPIVIIMFSNVVMFVMTALKIHRVQKEMSRIMAKEDSTRNLRNEKDRFGLFLRLFLVMGITWSLEIVSYFVAKNDVWSKIFYVADTCNAIQGFLIFTLFVMKRKVKTLIINRCSPGRTGSQQRQSQYSTRTTSSSVGNLPISNSLPSTEKPLVRPKERVTSFG